MNDKNLVNFSNGTDTRRNLKGRPKKIPSLDVLLEEVLGEDKTKDITYAEAILKALRAKALKGDVRACELLIERAYGKVKQQLDYNVKSELMIAKVEIVKIIQDERTNQVPQTGTPIDEPGVG